jgi:3D (Asp-Asp-Asp) domain-containing protein
VSPAAAAIARRALLGGRVAAPRPPRNDHDRDGRSWWLWLLVGAPVGLVIALVLLVALLAGALEQHCAGADATAAADARRTGALGGVGGSGLTRAQISTVREGSPYASARLTPGEYVSTSYGPPWGGIQGAGHVTSGGLRINGGRPRWYIVAVDPVLIGHGRLVYLWPNPFDWAGPFLAADTGGAIQQHRIDFYDWRGRTHQRAWGRRPTTLTTTPHTTTPATGRAAATTGASLVERAAALPADCAGTDDAPGSSAGGLALPGVRGRVTVAPLANAPGRPIRPALIAFLQAVAGIAARDLILTTGTNHSELTSSGRVSDHVLGLAGDFGSVANHFPLGGGFGTRLAAAALRAAGLPEPAALRLAAAGGGHNICHQGWRVQVIWRTGEHHDHVHIGLRHRCAFTGVQTFQIR